MISEDYYQAEACCLLQSGEAGFVGKLLGSLSMVKSPQLDFMNFPQPPALRSAMFMLRGEGFFMVI